MSIYSIDKIITEAKAEALKNSNVNTVCRYPFHLPEGKLFKQTFEDTRREIERPTNDKAAADIVAKLDQFDAVEVAAA